MATMLGRSSCKYGERAYRFALLEAGHIAQNLLLVAESDNLATVPIGGFLDDAVSHMLGLDGCEEFASYMVLIGTRLTEIGNKDRDPGQKPQ